MHQSFIAIFAAAAASWLFGAAYYMGLGKQYQAALGLNPEDCKGKPMPIVPLVVCFLGEALMALIFSWLLAGLAVQSWHVGAISGFFIALGFVLPPVVINNLFGGRKCSLSLIDGAHWVGVAMIQGAVLVALS